jgi:uncharacterized protein (DUF2141 family)
MIGAAARALFGCPAGWRKAARATPVMLLLLLGMSAVCASGSGRGIAAASPVPGLVGSPGVSIVPGDAPLSRRLVAPASAASQTGTLRVTIDGVRCGSGTIMIGLYDSSAGFLAAIKHSTEVGLLNDKGRVVGAALRAAVGSQSIVFTQLVPGRYAVIVFHDENDNGRLDENSWGVPTEGYGFSNNAEGFLSSPSFDAAGVTLDGADDGIAISLIYPRSRATSGLPESP